MQAVVELPRKKRPPPADPDEAIGPRFEEKDLRWFAGVLYVVTGCSIATMATHPVLSSVSQRTLERWSALDHWQAERKKVQDHLRAQIIADLGNDLTRQRREHLAVLNDLFNVSIKNLKRVKPKTWEGVAATTVKLAKVMDEFRAAVLSDVANAFNRVSGESASVPKCLTPQLADEEREVLAKALLDYRVAQQNKRIEMQERLLREDA